MSSASGQLPFRLAIATAACTFVLLLIGGLVHPTGSSLACPDWPLCFGQVMPKMEGGVLYEHSHRLAATFVGFLTCVLAFVTWRVRKDRSLTRLGLLLVAAVVVQGILGGITVLLKLPMLVSSAHLALSMAFFLLVLHACFRLAPASARSPAGPAPRLLIGIACAATYAQVVLGGFVRHSGAGFACGREFPLCGGEAWPALPVAQVHQLHRIVGVALVALIAAASLSVLRHARAAERPLARWAAMAAPVLALAQVALGVATVMTGVAVAPVAAHLGVAALLLASLFVAYRALEPRHAAASEVAGWPAAAGAALR